MILQAKRRIVEPLRDILQHLRDVCGFVGHCLLRLLLSRYLGGAVLLHLSEGVGKAVEVIALLTQLGLTILQRSLFELICSGGRFSSRLPHSLRSPLELASLGVLSSFVRALCGLLGVVASSLGCGRSVLQGVCLFTRGSGELVKLANHILSRLTRRIRLPLRPLGLLSVAGLWLALLWLTRLRLGLLRLSLLWFAGLRFALLRLTPLWLTLLRCTFLRLTLLRLPLLWTTLFWLPLFWPPLFRCTLLWLAFLGISGRLCSAVFREFADLLIQLIESFFQLFGLLRELLSFGVLLIDFLLFGFLSGFGGRVLWCRVGSGLIGIGGFGSIAGFGIIAGFGSIFRLWVIGELFGGIVELLAYVFDILLWLFQVSLAEFAEGIIEWLDGGLLDILGLLCDFASELFGFVARLLQLTGNFLGIASGITGFFADSFGQVLLAACEVLKLLSSFGGAIELRFAGGLEEFLFALEEVIQVATDFLLFLLQPLAFLCELLIEFFGLLSGLWSGLTLLLEFFGVCGEFFGVECESIEVSEVLFELGGALDFLDGAIEFITAAVEFVGGLLEVPDSGVTFGGCGLIEQFGDVLSDVLSKFRELCGLLLHQRMFAGLFSEPLEFVALSLIFFAESACVLAGLSIPVALGLITELSGCGGVFAKLFRHGFEGVNELLVGLPQCLTSQCFGVIADANGPGAFPDHLGPGNLPLIRRPHAKFHGITLTDAQRLQVQPKFVGDVGRSVIQRHSRDHSHRVLVLSQVQFEQAHSDVIDDAAVDGNNVVGAYFEPIRETGDAEDGWGIGRDEQSAVRFAAVRQTVFVCGMEAEAAAAECLKAEHGGEAVRSQRNFRDDRSERGGDGVRTSGRSVRRCSGHGRTGCGCSQLFRELFRGGRSGRVGGRSGNVTGWTADGSGRRR